jgi:hypothetical protein
MDELIGCEAQDVPGPGIGFRDRFRGKVIEGPVKEGTVPQNAVDQFEEEGAVAGVELPAGLVKQRVGKASALGAVEDG